MKDIRFPLVSEAITKMAPARAPYASLLAILAIGNIHFPKGKQMLAIAKKALAYAQCGSLVAIIVLGVHK